MKNILILIVDDEQENRENLAALLEREGWSCLIADSGENGLKLIKDRLDIDFLITDLKMPGMSGLELLEAARILRPELPRILVTAYGTIEDTVKAMKVGAFDVISKPIKIKALKDLIHSKLSEQKDELPQFKELRAQRLISHAYLNLTETLKKSALSNATVLLTGESGTGKSFLAKMVHDFSPRSKAPFIEINCAAIPHELLESELFGHEKGAFTGALSSRDGKIAAANMGTLFLDEIGDLSPTLQGKILHFLQNKKYFKLGSNTEIKADVRVIAASNKNLLEMSKKGSFREDLLFRLKVIDVAVPALKNRMEDLYWLVPILLDRLSEKHSFPKMRLNPSAFGLLHKYSWPGNVRELENVLERSLVLATEEEKYSGLLNHLNFPSDISALADASAAILSGSSLPIIDLATLEKRAIEQALSLTQGNKKLAAQILGISERTLYRNLSTEA